MNSLALFPCRFTDSARVVGELSYTLSLPVYTDQTILSAVSDQLHIAVEYIQKRLFSWTNRAGCGGMEKELFIQAVQEQMDGLQTAGVDYLYFGFFTSLIEQSCGQPHRLLIYSDESRRIDRGMRMEHLTRTRARRIVREHDQKAARWTRYLFDRGPYDPALFDSVVRYEDQDLFDVVSYICILFENDPFQQAQPQTCGMQYA